MSSINLNPQDATFIANPYPIYEQLRQTDPLHYRADKDDWILTRYADVKFVLRDKRFEFPDGSPERPGMSSSWQDLFEPPLNGHKFWQLRQKCQGLSQLWLVNRSSAAHTRIKRVIANAFSPPAVERLRPKIESIANLLIDQIEEKEDVDMIAAFASPLPIMVMSEILHLPTQEMRQHFDQWAKDIMPSIEIDSTLVAQERGLMASIGLTRYLYHIINERKDNIQDDPLSALISAYQQGQLSLDELLANGTFLLLAGIVTTQGLIGKAILTLLRHPQQKETLQRQPHLISSAIEECLRYEPPTHLTVRVANEDVVIDGQMGRMIKKGQKVRLSLAAANRDPAHFCQPNQFNITRHAAAHLAFGYGRHHCPGAYLGRVEAQIAIATLLKRLPNLALAKDSLPEWKPGLRTHGLKALTVVF